MDIQTIIIIALVVVSLWLAGVYNTLIRARVRVREAWSDIDVQLKRRYDLIPNMIETVKGYASHEASVLENVTKARSEAMSAQTVADHGKAENMLTGALKSLFALSENYPDLKASQNFAKLQDELSDTENKIQAARRFYNTNVMTMNTKVQVFPMNVVASMFGFKKESFFETEEGEKEPVKVSF
jgi:LemA protein